MTNNGFQAKDKKLRILLIDDNPDDRNLVIRELKREFSSPEVIQIFDPRGLSLALGSWDVDIVITDFQLRWTDGLKVLKQIKSRHAETPVIMFTGTGSEEVAVEALKTGLDDYIVKSPSHFVRLGAAVGHVLERAWEREERKRAEHKLQQSEDRFHQIFLQHNDAVVLLDIKTFEVLDVNKAAVKLYGYTDIEMIGQTPCRFMDKEEVDKLHKFARAGVPGDSRQFTDLIQHDREGAKLFITAVTQILEVGHKGLLYCSFRDITKKRRMESALKRKSQLATLGHLASGMAHEINTPLAAIAGCSEELLERLKAILPDSLDGHSVFVDYLKIIHAEAFRSSEIIQSMLVFTRERPMERNAIDLTKLIESTVQILGSQARSNGTYFVLDIEDIPEISGDGDKLKQVLINIAVNAMEAMPNGGKITISCRECPENGDAIICITDEGTGIPESELDKVFQPFFTLKSGNRGTGLGLSIADSIVSGHGGRIEISSVLKAGTTVTVYLPGSNKKPP